jgi:hypothetical protein
MRGARLGLDRGGLNWMNWDSVQRRIAAILGWIGINLDRLGQLLAETEGSINIGKSSTYCGSAMTYANQCCRQDGIRILDEAAILPPMPRLELFRWYVHGCKTTTSWRMTAETDIALDPNARPNLDSREVRDLPKQGNEGAAIVKRGGGAIGGQ